MGELLVAVLFVVIVAMGAHLGGWVDIMVIF